MWLLWEGNGSNNKRMPFSNLLLLRSRLTQFLVHDPKHLPCHTVLGFPERMPNSTSTFFLQTPGPCLLWQGGKMLKFLFSQIFHAELAILYQNWMGYICVDIGQNVVPKIFHLYLTYSGIFEKTMFYLLIKISPLLKYMALHLKVCILQILVPFDILFFIP